MDLFCLGELLVDMMPLENGGPDAYQMHVGGAAGNVAVATALLGTKSGVLSKVGDDSVGHKILAELEKRGVDTRGVCTDPTRRSTLVLVSLDERKVPQYLFYRENAATLSFQYKDLPKNLLETGRGLYFSSIFLTNPALRQANYEVAAAAKEHGLTIFFDVNLRLGLWQSAEEAKRELLAMCENADVLKVNDEELAFLFGEGEADAVAKGAMNRFASLAMVVVTLGPNGASLYTRDGLAVYSPAYPADVVNTSGAGDAFFGSILHWYLKDGLPKTQARLEAVGSFANVAAYLTACKPGAMQALPTLGEVEALLD